MRLILDNTELFPDVKNVVKLYRENPVLSQSGDYTMEITLPFDILENRRFFGMWNRFDATRRAKIYEARLVASDQVLLVGSAKVTNVTRDAVRVQLAGSRSELNSLAGDRFIDELDLPKVNGGVTSGSGLRGGGNDGGRGDR